MHTPDQARELWCPMVRIARHEVANISTPGPGRMVVEHDEHFIVGGCNTDALGRYRVPNSCRCIADQCAMWRWVPEDRATPPRYMGWCGLAGRPELP